VAASFSYGGVQLVAYVTRGRDLAVELVVVYNVKRVLTPETAHCYARGTKL
jgi:hypothetical protein